VVGIISAVVVIQMAGAAGRRSSRVLSILVAVRAGGELVLPVQEELVVDKVGTTPALGTVAVAGDTIGGEASLLVVGVVRVVVVFQMAGDTGCGSPGIKSVLVAVRTGRELVLPLQNELAVVKPGGFPGVGGIAVADDTVGRETRLLMVRVIGAVVIFQMA
jgi:hypothetical protein